MATSLYLQQSTHALPTSDHELEYLEDMLLQPTQMKEGGIIFWGVYDKTPVLVRDTVRK